MKGYYIKQQDIFTSAVKELSSPVIWNTQRQMGKSTALAKIAAELLKTTDVTYTCFNAHTNMMFIQKVLQHMNKDVLVRNTKNSIQLVTPNKTYSLSPLQKDRPNKSGVLLIDEVAYIGYDRIHDMIDNFPTPPRVIGTTTGMTEDIIQLITDKVSEPEVITVVFNSIDELYRKQSGAVVKPV
jgi:tRNA(Met) C34 N-acetyltransferase TmcA